MANQVTTVVAFGAGVVSFLSPCVLPLVPGYLSFVAGVSTDQIKGFPTGTADEGGVTLDRSAIRRRVVLNTLAFVLGFSLVFVALGASATAVGSFLLAHQKTIARIAGAVVVLFGLHTMGLLRMPFLYQEKRWHVLQKPAGLAGAFTVGLAFAFGWTPCIGPILAGILALATQEETVTAGIALLSAYSLGLALPFMLTALAFNQLIVVFDRVKRHLRTVEIASGLLLVGVGLLLMTGKLTVIASWAQRIPFLNGLAL